MLSSAPAFAEDLNIADRGRGSHAGGIGGRIAAGGIKFVAEAVCGAHPYTGRDRHLEMRQVPLAR